MATAVRMLKSRASWSVPVACFAALLSSCNASSCNGPVEGTRSSLIVLVDYSKSFAPLGPEDRPALQAVTQIVRKLANERLEQPVKILWSIIGNESLRPLQPCGPAKSFTLKLTGRTSGTGDQELISQPELKDWLETCTDAVASLSQNNVQEFTDISGAVAFAAANGESVQTDRLLVIFSDFIEDLPPKHTATPFTLHGERVMMLWRPGSQDHQAPSAMMHRLEDWRARFTAAGAKATCTRPVLGLSADDVPPCLWPTQ